MTFDSMPSTLRVLPILGLILLLATAIPAQAQERGSALPRVSPNASVSQTVGITEVRVTYGRPAVRDREIFGDLVPYDEVWRTGANEATTISFSTPVSIEGEELEAGTYGLFTIPGEDAWTFILNDVAEQWGAYNYDASEDVLRVEVTPTSAPMHEQMTFGFTDVTDSSATLTLTWADTRAPVSLSVETNALIAMQAEAAAESATDWRAPLRYASYALQNKTMIDRAVRWADASINIEETFPGLAVKSRLLAAQENYGAAAAAAEDALALAESMDEMPRGAEDLRSAMEEWRAQ